MKWFSHLHNGIIVVPTHLVPNAYRHICSLHVLLLVLLRCKEEGPREPTMWKCSITYVHSSDMAFWKLDSPWCVCMLLHVHNYMSRFKVQVRGCNILLLSWAWCLSDHLQGNSIHSVLTDKHSGAGLLEGFECCETGDCPVLDPRIVPIIPTAAEGEPGARVSDTVQTTLGV